MMRKPPVSAAAAKATEKVLASDLHDHGKGLADHGMDLASHGAGLKDHGAELGAKAYATGNDILFKSSAASPATAAHEAAHVVQQRAGRSAVQR
jgi:Domain of unknown function (DUF4157)